MLPREFQIGELVLLFNSRFKIFPCKPKYKWIVPQTITQVYGNGSIEIEDAKGLRFTVNGQRWKAYIGESQDVRVVEVVFGSCLNNTSLSCCDIKLGTSWEATQVLVFSIMWELICASFV